MQLIVGLGNPGEKYQYTRHNIGYMAIDNIVSAQQDYKIKKKFNSIIYETIIDKNRIILIKPETYMNNSGDAVFQIANFYKIDSKNILVLHDELDIPFGKIRIKSGGGNAGHNGLKSISNKYSSIKFGNLDSLHADGYVFLKGNQKTGNVFVRSENGLGEGILITCQYDEDAEESNTFGPLPLDFFYD